MVHSTAIKLGGLSDNAFEFYAHIRMWNHNPFTRNRTHVNGIFISLWEMGYKTSVDINGVCLRTVLKFVDDSRNGVYNLPDQTTVFLNNVSPVP